MAVTQTIPNTLLSGQRTFTFANTAQPWSDATVTIDRTIAGGLNSLTSADSLDIAIDYSTDGGVSWLNVAGSTLHGGTIVTKGVTLAQDTLGIGIGRPFPVGTSFRVQTQVSGAAVRVAGTLVYS